MRGPQKLIVNKIKESNNEKDKESNNVFPRGLDLNTNLERER